MGITFFEIINISKKNISKKQERKKDEMIHEICPITEIHDIAT